MSCVVNVCAAVLLAGQTQASEYQIEPDLRCGIKCLYVALKALGLAPAELSELEKNSKSDGTLGYSMHELEVIARKRGAHTITVDTSLDNLSKRKEKFACITIIKEASYNHYVLLYDSNHSSVNIIDVPKDYRVPKNVFNTIWSKKCLLIGPAEFEPEEALNSENSKNIINVIITTISIFLITILIIYFLKTKSRRPSLPLAIIPLVLAGVLQGCASSEQNHEDQAKARAEYTGGKLRIEPSSYKLGDIKINNINETIKLDSIVHNDGDTILLIREVITGCNCASSKIDKSAIPPKSHAILETVLKLGYSAESRVAMVQLTTSDSSTPRAEVSYEWRTVNPLCFDPPRYDLPRVDPGKQEVAEFSIKGLGLPACNNYTFDVVSDSNLVKCEVVILSNIASASSVNLPTEESVRLGTLITNIMPTEDLAFHDVKITLRLLCNNIEKARAILPLTWHVGSILEVSPSRIFLGRKPAGSWESCNVLVNSPQDKRFIIHDITSSDENSKIDFIKSSSKSIIHNIRIKIKMPDHVGPWNAKLHILTDHDGAHSVILPVSALLDPPR